MVRAVVLSSAWLVMEVVVSLKQVRNLILILKVEIWPSFNFKATMTFVQHWHTIVDLAEIRPDVILAKTYPESWMRLRFVIVTPPVEMICVTLPIQARVWFQALHSLWLLLCLLSNNSNCQAFDVLIKQTPKITIRRISHAFLKVRIPKG